MNENTKKLEEGIRTIDRMIDTLGMADADRDAYIEARTELEEIVIDLIKKYSAKQGLSIKG